MIDSLKFPKALCRLAEEVGVTPSDTSGDESNVSALRAI
jgi:hypothetical protein